MKNMVRILVGTMLEVGRGRISACQIPKHHRRKSSAAGPTAAGVFASKKCLLNFSTLGRLAERQHQAKLEIKL